MSNKAIEYFNIGAWQSVHLMNGPKGTLNVAGLNSYIDTFSKQLLSQSLSTVMLSYCQVVSLVKVVQGDYSGLTGRDGVGALYVNVKGAKVNGVPVFDYMINRLIHNGVKVGLSFGGRATPGEEWNFGFVSGVKAETLAKNLATWAKKLGLTILDFSLETLSINRAEYKNWAIFFNTLQSSFTDGSTTLTVMGDATIWGVNGYVLGNLFKLMKFTDMFDSLQLKSSNGQYYLNAGQTPVQTWDLITWMKELSENTGLSNVAAAALIGVSFGANLDYTLATSSAGPVPYKSMPKGLTSGAAAAFIYAQLAADMKVVAGKTVVLGTPFFLDTNASYEVLSTNHYQSTFFENTKNFELDFFSK